MSFTFAQLDHRAQDGGRVDDLPRQARRLKVDGSAVALVTVGGNDLLTGLAADRGNGMVRFQQRLDAFLHALPVRAILLGTGFTIRRSVRIRATCWALTRALHGTNLNRVNAIIAELAVRYGQLVDLHRHFLGGDPSWFTCTIEPSLRGASEIRRVPACGIEGPKMPNVGGGRS